MLLVELNESTNNTIEENSSGKKKYIIEGIFLQADTQNGNRRVYPKSLLNEVVNNYNTNSISMNRAFGELGHPDSRHINFDRVSHMITSLKESGNNYIGKAKILDTPFGKIVKTLIDEGAKFGVSSRGMGSIREIDNSLVVQEDYRMITAADIVADPSVADAYVEAVLEHNEGLWNNGSKIEEHLEKYRENVLSSNIKTVEENFLKDFNDFLSKL